MQRSCQITYAGGFFVFHPMHVPVNFVSLKLEIIERSIALLFLHPILAL